MRAFLDYLPSIDNIIKDLLGGYSNFQIKLLILDSNAAVTIGMAPHRLHGSGEKRSSVNKIMHEFLNFQQHLVIANK